MGKAAKYFAHFCISPYRGIYMSMEAWNVARLTLGPGLCDTVELDVNQQPQTLSHELLSSKVTLHLY